MCLSVYIQGKPIIINTIIINNLHRNEEHYYTFGYTNDLSISLPSYLAGIRK